MYVFEIGAADLLGPGCVIITQRHVTFEFHVQRLASGLPLISVVGHDRLGTNL